MRRRLNLEVLEQRLPLSAMHALHAVTTPAQRESKGSSAYTIQPGNTLTVLEGFVAAYPSMKGQAKYNPIYDVNHNGQVGQTDGRILLHSLPPLSPKIPLTLNLAIAPPDRTEGHVPTNLGGNTYSKYPTIVGHTTPGALIFTGAGTLDAKLRGPAIVANAKGNFSLNVNLTTGINEFDFQAVNAYGQQTRLDFPILWMGFAKYERSHPTND
jgi:hypothetical protein